MIPALSPLAGALDVVLGSVVEFLSSFLFFFFYPKLFLFLFPSLGEALQNSRLAANSEETRAGQRHRSPAQVGASKGTREKIPFAKVS